MSTALYEEMGFNVARPIVLLCDNNSTVWTYASDLPEWRSAMLGTRYHRSREYIDNGDIRIVHVDGVNNPADLHTKWLPISDHLRYARWLGLYEPNST